MKIDMTNTTDFIDIQYESYDDVNYKSVELGITFEMVLWLAESRILGKVILLELGKK